MAKNIKVHYSSKSDEWTTPDELFSRLDKLYGPFKLDAAASASNTKCSSFYDEQTNGLINDWSGFGTIWCNPPYSDLKSWVKKAYDESQLGCRVVMLIPSRTDTTAFHDYIMEAKEVLFIRGRVKFSASKNSAPFPSLVVVFEQGKRKTKFRSFR